MRGQAADSFGSDERQKPASVQGERADRDDHRGELEPRDKDAVDETEDGPDENGEGDCHEECALKVDGLKCHRRQVHG